MGSCCPGYRMLPIWHSTLRLVCWKGSDLSSTFEGVKVQIIAAVLRDAGDKTKLALLFANQTEEDILCRYTVVLVLIAD